jgi:plasmid stabilization system protein ParE
MPDYRLSPEAIADLEDIYAQGFQQFGAAQAERFSPVFT